MEAMHLRIGATLLTALALTACNTMPKAPDYTATPPEEPLSVAQTNGSIFQNGHDVALFENAVARRVGDTLTIHLIESTNASKSSSTTTKKATNATLPGPTIAGRPVTVHGTEVLNMGLDHSSSFDGQG